MYIIKHKSKKGGFWSEGKLTPEIRTEDADIAEAYRNKGHTVKETEEEKKQSKKN